MDTKIGLLALIEIFSALTSGLFMLFITYRLFQRAGERFLGMKAETNVSYSIIMASVLFAMGYTMSTVIDPLISVFRLLLTPENAPFETFLTFIVQGGLYIAIAFVSSALIIGTGLLMYTKLTPLNELKEIQNNNIGVALVLSSIIITLSLMSHSGIALLLESIVPYPEVPNYY